MADTSLGSDPDLAPHLGAGSRRHQIRIVLAAGALALTAASVATHAALADDGQPKPQPLAPTTAFAVLAAPQQPSDVIDSPHLRYLVRPDTTRFLGETPIGPAYLGVGITGDACLVTLRAQGAEIVPDTGCTPWPSDSSTAVMSGDGPRDEDVLLVPDGYQHDEAWRGIHRNLLIKVI
ncbi:hypothetical protein CLV92_1027 [Kineococcus xinjiangensis]|uniref:Uncharacterized protein n=1 Tax=Kineococcus xinjiangensis TaxID=512762 RepID=A0A2S6IUA6_9ACTN|nr:hypothetical protein [Kineococcus xinjiangensis]PPK97857.1 hypothetical protein CLV92_1027 [Kineococcus xinjiangensis]